MIVEEERDFILFKKKCTQSINVYKKGFESKKIELFRRGEICQRMIRSGQKAKRTPRAEPRKSVPERRRCMPTGLNLVFGVELTNYQPIICHREEGSALLWTNSRNES